MPKQINNLIKSTNPTINDVVLIQESILTDKSIQALFEKIKNKLVGIEKTHLKLLVKCDENYSFSVELSSKSDDELQIIYFRINQDLEITNYNHKFAFEDMSIFADDLKNILENYFG